MKDVEDVSKMSWLRSADYDNWGWVYLFPILLIQGFLFAAVFRARTIRFQQLILCISGFYWSTVVYYIQHFPMGSKVMFCDVSFSKCSYCLNESVSYLPGYFGLVEKGSSMNRSIADTSFLFYSAHILYPLVQKVPLVGKWMTHLGFVGSLVVSVFCVYLLQKTFVEMHDVCLVNLIMYVINWALCWTMYLHLDNLVTKQYRRKQAQAQQDDAGESGGEPRTDSNGLCRRNVPPLSGGGGGVPRTPRGGGL